MAVRLFRSLNYGRRRFVWLFPALMLVNTFFFYDQTAKNDYRIQNETQQDHDAIQRSRKILATDSILDCIPHAINEFPEDFFTQSERLQGGLVIHFMIAFFLFSTLAIVCDDFFVPSLEIISETLKVPTDVAGATFMAIGTSSPELFSSLIGSFITEGDIGIGTIVGSAVFNILGVTSLAGLVVWKKGVDVDWYPITRDCSMYTISVVALIVVINDNLVYWWEALVLVILFFLYIIIMYFNSSIEIFFLDKMARIQGKNEYEVPCRFKEPQTFNGANEKSSLIWKTDVIEQQEGFFYNSTDTGITSSRENQDRLESGKDSRQVSEDDDSGSICKMPYNSSIKQIWWVLMWPINLLLFLTIPDCRKPNLSRFFPVTFIMSVLWIGAVSYLCVWMVTIISYTLYIPDTVAGLTLLAVGTSVPEVISSIIVVKNGLGNMAICNLLGSNIFDILFCLGAPWLIKTLAISTNGSLIINSSALTFTTITLLSTVLMLYGTFYFSKWQLNFKVGFICLFLYIAFMTLSCLYELNVFGDFNPPGCPRLD